MRKKPVFLIALVIAGLGIDQFTKIWARAYFAANQSIMLVKDLFELRYAENNAVAFSLLQFIPYGPRRWIVVILTSIMIGGLVWLVGRWRTKRTLELAPLAMIISGASGNLLNRVFFGYVIDFLHLHYRDVWSWPIFNVADSLISTGVVLFMLLNRKLLFESGNATTEEEA